MIPALCYGLLALAWLIDLFTPQLFVAAILLDGPIALSSLALRPALTVRLIVFAEIANTIAGYMNGVQAGYHWDSIALGDRVLSAASFVLVGVLTIRSQDLARRAGEADERERAAERERALRVAADRVRATLNLDLVARAAVREALAMFHGVRASLVLREAAFDAVERYDVDAPGADPRVGRMRLTHEEASLIERAREARRVLAIDGEQPLGRLLEGRLLVGWMPLVRGDGALLITLGETSVPTSQNDLQVFVDVLRVALEQAQLFAQLGEQNEQIAAQRNEIRGRSEVIRDLVYALAHDLRTPLSAADVTMRQALAGAYGSLPERYAHVLATSIASNDDLRRLVETLLLVARYEAGEDSKNRTHVELQPILERVRAEMSPVAELKGVDIEIAAETDAAVDAEADELRRAVTNLVANALDATPAGGRIALSLSLVAHERRAEVCVDDTGYGVPEDRRSALFERFAGMRRGGGTGLGLYIVRRIAEKYGGTVRYEPRTAGGSRFAVSLPLAEES